MSRSTETFIVYKVQENLYTVTRYLNTSNTDVHEIRVLSNGKFYSTDAGFQAHLNEDRSRRISVVKEYIKSGKRVFTFE